MERLIPVGRKMAGLGSGILHKATAMARRFIEKYNIQIKIFLICVVAKTLFNICNIYILRLNKGPDEIGTIAGAAFFAGKDWTALLELGSQYFGFGYSFFMTPLFWLFSDKLVLYHSMLFYNSLCLATMMVLCYNIVLGLGVERKYCVWITIASSLFYMPLSASNMVTNDIMLLLLHWVILYVVLLLHKRRCTGKSVLVLSAILALVMCYGFTVHTRIIYLWGGVAVLIVLYLLMQRKFLVNIPVFCGVFAVCYFVAKTFVNFVQQNAWSVSEQGEALNSAESIFEILGRIDLLFSRIGIRAYIATVFGQTFGSFILTGGVMAICLFAFAYLLYVFLRRYFNKENCEEAELQRQQAILLIGMYGIAIFAASILITSVGALPYAIDALEAGKTTKWFLYARYWAVSGGSCILFALLMLLEAKFNKKVLVIGSAALLCLVSGIVLLKLADNFVGAVNSSTTVYEPFAAIMLMEWGEKFTVFSFVKSAIITVLLFVGIVSMYLKNKQQVSCFLLAALSAFIWIYCTLEIERPFSRNQYEMLGDVEDFLVSLDAKENDYRILLNSGLSTTRNAYFALHEYNLGLFSPDEVENTDQIVVGSSLSTQCLGEGFYMVYENEKRKAVFIKGEQIQQMAISRGYELVAYDRFDFTQGRLHYIDAFNENSGMKGLIPPDGTQFGPYIALSAGSYQITIEGYELESCVFDVMATLIVESEEALQSMDGEQESNDQESNDQESNDQESNDQENSELETNELETSVDIEVEEEPEYEYIYIDLDDIVVTNDVVTYMIETTEDFDIVEFRAFNVSDHQAYVHKISLEKVNAAAE